MEHHLAHDADPLHLRTSGCDVRSVPRGPTDRQRRQRIIDATLRVITDIGVSGLSHRRIAKAAGVPLSATTYYFGTMDELLEAAFSEAVERDRVRLGKDVLELDHDENPTESIVQLMLRIIDDEPFGVLTLELGVAALRSPGLRPLAQSWDDLRYQALEPHLGSQKAALVNVLMAGVIMRESMAAERMTADELAGMLRAVLASADALNATE
jgi:DNA-binding transcriptional regulator YbjK